MIYEMELLRDAGIQVQYQKGQQVFVAGQAAESVFLLESGVAGIYDKSGIKRGGRMVENGELLGLEDVLRGVLRTYSVIAVSDAVFTSVGKKDFQGLLDYNPFLLSRIIKFCSAWNNGFAIFQR